MYELSNGRYFRAFVSSDDLTTAAEITLKDRDGNTITLGSSDRAVLSDVVINNGATASVVTVFADDDADGAKDSGEEVYAASLAAKGQASSNFVTPLQAKQGSKLYAVASAASAGTTLIITGQINNT